MSKPKRKSQPEPNHWPFPATDLTSLQKLVNRSPREEPNATRDIAVATLKQYEDAPL